MNSTATMTIDNDNTRRKRLKVVSACGECRRKKTKCNGERPCAGCIKAHVECKYVNSPKVNHQKEQVVTKPTLTKPASIESIEARLATIENILRALLGSGKNKHLLQGLERSEPPASVSESFTQPYHSDSSSSLCGDMYSSTPLVHVPPILNRNIPREKRQRHEEDGMTDNANKKRVMVRDSHGYYSSSPLLAPIKIITHQPGIPTIKNLLNDDDNNTDHPSAFYRMSSSHRLNNTAQTTAAGTTT